MKNIRSNTQKQTKHALQYISQIQEKVPILMKMRQKYEINKTCTVMNREKRKVH